MFRKILLASAAVATLGVPAAANAQYYGHSSGSYGHGRHYYWDGHHYRDRNNNAIIDTIIGGLIGYAVGSMSNSGYGYSYPTYNYGSYYSNPGYGYNYQYSNPGYGYNYQNSYPGYGYSNSYYYNHRRW